MELHLKPQQQKPQLPPMAHRTGNDAEQLAREAVGRLLEDGPVA